MLKISKINYLAKKFNILNKANFLVVLFVALFLVFVPKISLADETTIILPDPLGGVTFGQLMTNVVVYISGLVVSLSTVMFIYAGILFLVSAGNESKLSQARKVALYAAIGTGIALGGVGLVELVQFIIGVPVP